MLIDKHYRINTPDIIHETIDDEVIIVHMTKGHYYSLQGVGVDIWEGLEAGLAAGDILEMVSQRYTGRKEETQEGVIALIDQLEAETLIVAISPADEQTKEGKIRSPIGPPARPFITPTLEKYTDVEDLLLLDPIHDVVEIGWPNAG